MIKKSSPNLCVNYFFSRARVVQGMPLHPCLCTSTLEGAVKGSRLCAPRRGSLDSFVKSATPHAALSFCCSSANFLSSATVLELDINV